MDLVRFAKKFQRIKIYILNFLISYMYYNKKNSKWREIEERDTKLENKMKKERIDKGRKDGE